MKPIDDAKIKKILYINLAFMGDLLLATPALRALRERFPQAKIDMLVTPWAAQIAGGNPFVDQVRIYDKKGRERKLINALRMVCQLREESYDLTITANFSVRGAILSRLLGARYRIGYDIRGGSVFLTHPVSAKRLAVKHETENQAAILQPLGIEVQDYRLSFTVKDEQRQALAKKMGALPDAKKILLCPYGRHPLNSWTDDGYRILLRELSNSGTVYIIGGKAERERLEQLADSAGGAAVVLAGNLEMPELAALMEQSDVMISVDTGPMHLAAAVGVPILALFGRSDERVWGPRGPRDRVIRAAGIDCAPCIQPRECEHLRCMKAIQPTEVIRQALDMLGFNAKEERV